MTHNTPPQTASLHSTSYSVCYGLCLRARFHPRHATPRFISSLSTTPRHATPHHAMPCHAMFHIKCPHVDGTSRHALSRHATLRHATSRHFTSRQRHTTLINPLLNQNRIGLFYKQIDQEFLSEPIAKNQKTPVLKEPFICDSCLCDSHSGKY